MLLTMTQTHIGRNGKDSFSPKQTKEMEIIFRNSEIRNLGTSEGRNLGISEGRKVGISEGRKFGG